MTLPRLEQDILLSYVLGVDRAKLYSHPEISLTDIQKKLFSNLVARRMNGEPIAYITGNREFWSLNFMVTNETLIPRPETEILVETILERSFHDSIVIADLGTGSGAIALSLAHEKPQWQIHATDNCPKALEIAKKNAKLFNLLSVEFHEGNWFSALPPILFDVIVSNPPYIGEKDSDIKQEVYAYEPHCALFSNDEGFADLTHIIQESPHFLKPGGFLFLEHGFKQAEKLRKIFLKRGYTNVSTRQDYAGFDRITFGQWQF